MDEVGMRAEHFCGCGDELAFGVGGVSLVLKIVEGEEDAHSGVPDEFDGEFREGSFESTVWNADRVHLSLGAESGHFVSRVFDAGAPVRWSRIAW
ncbi:MAG TPA: hypothetical protein PKE25_06395, partial [Novosphingobium sp.]|nr:hypothetical protein [Novosphingobium sp.]